MQQNKEWLEEVLANVKIKALNEMQLASIQANDEHDNYYQLPAQVKPWLF